MEGHMTVLRFVGLAVSLAWSAFGVSAPSSREPSSYLPQLRFSPNGRYILAACGQDS